MKRIIVSAFFMLVTFIVLSGCSNSINQASDITSDIGNDITIESGIYDYERVWEHYEIAKDFYFVPTKEVAMEVATTLFKSYYQKEEPYRISDIFYDEQDEIWIIGFTPDIDFPEGAGFAGGGLYIACLLYTSRCV